MSEFYQGDKVRITIDATVHHADEGQLFYGYDCNAGWDLRIVRLDSDAVTVKHRTPDPTPAATKPAPDLGSPVSALGLSSIEPVGGAV